jgi:hypothetical protein
VHPRPCAPHSRFPSWRGKPEPATLLSMDSGGYVMLFGIVILVAVALVSRARRREETGAVTIGGTPEAALNEVAAYMVSRGFTISQAAATSATFSRHKKPNTDIGILLLLLAIVPGVLYFALAGRTRHTTVLALAGGAGTQLTMSGDDPQARRALREWARVELGTIRAPLEPEREPCWKCGSEVSTGDVRCPSCGAWLRPT